MSPLPTVTPGVLVVHASSSHLQGASHFWSSVTQGGRVMVIGAHAYLTLLVPGRVLQPYTYCTI